MAAQTLRIAIFAIDNASRQMKGITGAMNEMSLAAGVAGRSMVLVAAPLAAIGALSIRSAMQFESSFAGVRKTVEATEGQFQQLQLAFRAMATEIPISVNEINRIGEAAGQLGIKIENIEEFTRVMAALGVTTNLTSDQAATALARLANIMKIPEERFENLGSVVVDLGNNMATTEKEIIDFALRIAAAGKVAGFTERDVLAIGAAFSAVGVKSERGGTALQKMFILMSRAINQGGKDLEKFADITGQTTEEFVRSFREDASDAFADFVEGVGTAGEQVFDFLDELGVKDVRAVQSLLSIAGAGDDLRQAFNRANLAWDENIALAEESAIRYGTAESQMKLFKHELNELGIIVGQILVPEMLKLMEKVSNLVQNLQDLSRVHPTLIKNVMLVTAAILAFGAVLIATSVLLPALSLGLVVLKGAWFGLRVMMGLATVAQWQLNAAMYANPVGLVVLAVLALIVAVYKLRRFIPPILRTVGKAFDLFVSPIVFWLNEIIDLMNFFGASIQKLNYTSVGFEKALGAVGDSVEGVGDAIEGEITNVKNFFGLFDPQPVEEMSDELRLLLDPIDGLAGSMETAREAGDDMAAALGELDEQLRVINENARLAKEGVSGLGVAFIDTVDPIFRAMLAMSNRVAEIEAGLKKWSPAYAAALAKQRELNEAAELHAKLTREHGEFMDDLGIKTESLWDKFSKAGLGFKGLEADTGAVPSVTALPFSIRYGAEVEEVVSVLEKWTDALTDAQAAVVETYEESQELIRNLGGLDEALQIVVDQGLFALYDSLKTGALTVEEFVEQAREAKYEMERLEDEIKRVADITDFLVEHGMQDLIDSFNLNILTAGELEEAVKGLKATLLAQEKASELAAEAALEHERAERDRIEALEDTARAAERARDSLIDLQAQGERGFAARRSMQEKQLLVAGVQAFMGGEETSKAFLSRIPAMTGGQQDLLAQFGFNQQNIGSIREIMDFISKQIPDFFLEVFGGPTRGGQGPMRYTAGSGTRPWADSYGGGENMLQGTGVSLYSTPYSSTGTNTPHVTVNVDGNVYGLPDFETAVASAVTSVVGRGGGENWSMEPQGVTP